MLLPTRFTFIINKRPPITSMILGICLFVQLFGLTLNRTWPNHTTRACTKHPDSFLLVRGYLMRPAQMMLRKNRSLDPIVDNCSLLLAATLKTDFLKRIISKDKGLSDPDRVSALQAVDTLERESGMYWKN